VRSRASGSETRRADFPAVALSFSDTPPTRLRLHYACSPREVGRSRESQRFGLLASSLIATSDPSTRAIPRDGRVANCPLSLISFELLSFLACPRFVILPVGILGVAEKPRLEEKLPPRRDCIRLKRRALFTQTCESIALRVEAATRRDAIVYRDTFSHSTSR